MGFARQNRETGSFDVFPGFDTLTGLPNRTLFLSRVKEVLDSRTGDEILAVLFLHVDNYSEIQAAGNGVTNLIGAIAGRIQRSLHPQDYLSKIQHHAFAVLLTQLNDLSEVSNKCKQIQKSFENSFEMEGNSLRVKLSIGITIGSSPLDKADRLLFQAGAVASVLQRQGSGLFAYCNLSPGTRLGSFEITSFLAKGGMGEVYYARDTRMQREVAIKVLTKEVDQDPASQKQFQEESHAVEILSHPNVIHLIETGIFHGRCYLVMEKFSGVTLREKLQTQKIPLDRIMNYAFQIAAGLGALHEKGIVHGDLKPENIFITDDDRIKILDFALSRFVQNDGPDSFETGTSTRAENVLGTISYRSPEQVLGKPMDERSDIFSFGTVLYEMLCGEQAFDGHDPVDVLNSILKAEPHLLFSAQVPGAYNPVLAKCLRKSPSERYANAHQLALALKCCLGKPSTGFNL